MLGHVDTKQQLQPPHLRELTWSLNMSDNVNNTLTEAQQDILKGYLERYRDSNKKERRGVYREAWAKIQLGPPAVVTKKIPSVKKVNERIVMIYHCLLCPHKSSVTGR
jgi:hypothetical protein